VQTVVFSSRRAVRQTPVLTSAVSRAARRQPVQVTDWLADSGETNGANQKTEWEGRKEGNRRQQARKRRQEGALAPIPLAPSLVKLDQAFLWVAK